MKGFTLWLVQDKSVCLTCSQPSKHFHFSFYFSSSSTLHLILRRRCALLRLSLNLLGELITGELLIHCHSVQLHSVLWRRTHRALCCSNTKQHPSWITSLAVAQKPNLVSVCKTGGGSYTQEPHVHFNNSYLYGNETKSTRWFCPGAVSVMKMQPHYNPSKITILRQSCLKSNAGPWRF